MEIINLIRDCIDDCIEVILKRIEESDTVVDDMILEKIKTVGNLLKSKISRRKI
jgi:hypothetical protein